MRSALHTVCLWLTAGILLGAGPALAAGLPQLNPENFAPQVVWLAVAFTVLYLLMSRVVLPRISHVLDDRQRKIEENLRKAEQLKAEGEAAAAAYEKTIAAARAEAHEVLRKAHEELAKEANVRQAELTARLTDEIVGAEARIAAAKEAAVAGLRDMAVEVAASAVERLAGLRPDAKVVAAAVDQIMGERP